MATAPLTPQPITDALIRTLAAQYGYEAAALRAVLAVETGGQGFDAKTGKVLIQFEPAWFKKLLPKAKLADVSTALANKAGGTATPAQLALAANWQTVVTNKVDNQTQERLAFNAGWAIDPKTTMLATSFGMGQVMGFNHQPSGYPTVDAMVEAFRTGGEAEQMKGMCCFIASNPKLLKALRAKDWKTFAYYYNGSNYTVNSYDTLLAKHYAKWAATYAQK